VNCNVLKSRNYMMLAVSCVLQFWTVIREEVAPQKSLVSFQALPSAFLRKALRIHNEFPISRS